MDFKDHFHGKGVVITGALGLFGRGLAETFAKAGARVCVTDRDQADLEKLVRTLGVEGSFAHAADLTATDDLNGLIDAVGAKWGAPDIVINNAAIYPSFFMLDMEIDDWDQMMSVNLRAPFILTRGFGRQMIGKGVKGSIINIGSGASRKMRLTAAPYCISKTALDRLTKGMGQELAQLAFASTRWNRAFPQARKFPDCPMNTSPASPGQSRWAVPRQWTISAQQPCTLPVIMPATSPAQR